MGAGRPTEYDHDGVVGLIHSYLAERQAASRLPTVEGLALYLNVARSTIYEWADQHPEFSDILDSLLSLQADDLIHGGLTNKFNPAITKMLLTKHGYADRQELTGKDGQKLFDDKDARAKGDAAIAALTGEGDTEEGE